MAFPPLQMLKASLPVLVFFVSVAYGVAKFERQSRRSPFSCCSRNWSIFHGYVSVQCFCSPCIAVITRAPSQTIPPCYPHGDRWDLATPEWDHHHMGKPSRARSMVWGQPCPQLLWTILVISIGVVLVTEGQVCRLVARLRPQHALCLSDCQPQCGQSCQQQFCCGPVLIGRQ